LTEVDVLQSRDGQDALALGIGAAAPERLTGVFAAAGLATAHRRGAERAAGGVFLFPSSLDSGGAQLFSEAAAAGEFVGLRLFLVVEHVDATADQDDQSAGGKLVVVGVEPAGEFLLLVEDVDTGVVQGVAGTLWWIEAEREEFLRLRIVERPRDGIAFEQPGFIIAAEFAKAGFSDIGESHLGLFGSAGALRAFDDVGFARPGRLGHLVKLASARVVSPVEEAFAEAQSRELDDAGHDEGVEPSQR